MDAVTLYVVLMTAAGERRVIHETHHATMQQCRAVGVTMRSRKWNVAARGERIDVRCLRRGEIIIAD